MKLRIASVVALLAAAFFATGSAAGAPSTRNETRDWGVAPIADAKREDLHSPTPTTIPGGKTILASELYDLIRSDKKPVVIDVLGGDITTRSGLPGAIHMGAQVGGGRIGVEMRDRFRGALAKLTEGDLGKAIVFYCLSSECWLSYNAARRAIAAGYTDVYWFRGGFEAWKELKYPFEKATPFEW